MTSEESAAVLEFLSALERRESDLLSWGVVEGSFSRDEILDAAADWIELHPKLDLLLPDEVLDALVHRRLLWPMNGGERFRSRMAEAVRLMSRLRQLLEWTADEWRTAPTLVADFRLLLRPRRYPDRCVNSEDVADALEATGALNVTGRREVLGAMVGGWSLAQFQVDATCRILKHAHSDATTATIVCAGTGSGKTLAFYLPAMLDAATDKYQGTMCLAIYPRNELLKDQFTEAYRQARQLDAVQKAGGRPKVRIGALYGAVPRNAGSLRRPQQGRKDNWRRSAHREGFTCPFLRCVTSVPGDNNEPVTCGAEMVWLDSDVDARTERLHCTSCNAVATSDEVALTRETLLARPPAILFTNTEMPNRHMCDTNMAALFGIGRNVTPPRLVLLDEVHTYEGVYGAQVAYLLRRWRSLSGASTHFVGLSATLADAERFFADLVGLNRNHVAEISPAPGEMIDEGMEYMVALRGDPVSGASLLSTSTQAAMLLRRLLDPQDDPVSEGALGSKVYAFTDNLDVTNRFFHTLMDAEGWDRLEVPSDRQLGSLANYRSAARPDGAERLRDGQAWEMCEWIGHDLAPGARAQIGRTSSQDSGVDARAEVVVASPSLEVGIDDDAVGAVLQHKAPRSSAAFLQRKGRAGRQRGTRPWTVVTLSDYGRDRQAYQSYEQLFSPELAPRYLPIKNRYVQRIQAGFALVEWLGLRIPRIKWPDLAGPASESGTQFSKYTEKRQNRAISLLHRLMDEAEVQADLGRHLQAALGLTDAERDALLWEPPRAVLTALVPTLLRRLTRQWIRADGGPERRTGQPIPEFVPSTLFDDLNLPEVRIELPHDSDEFMPVAQALNEFAPGRVSRRFGVRHGGVSHWVEPKHGAINVDEAIPADAQEWLGTVEYLDVSGTRRALPCIRPHALKAEQIPRAVSTTSNAFPTWYSQLLPPGDGWRAEVPAGQWRELFAAIRFYTHDRHQAVEVRRFTHEAEYSIQRRGQSEDRGFCRYMRHVNGTQTDVALGYIADVDAVVFQLRPPVDLRTLVSTDAELLRSLRPALFQTRVRKDPLLWEVGNSFRLDWLSQIYLSAVTHEAISRCVSLQDAHTAVLAGSASVGVTEVLSVIFQSVEVDGDDEEQGRLHKRLAESLADARVRDAFERHGPVLWRDPDASWDAWLGKRFAWTWGAALAQAARHMCPQLDLGDLVVDVDAGPQRTAAPLVEIWLSESRIGGSGFIEALREGVSIDPQMFFQVVQCVLQPGDGEMVDMELGRLLGTLASDPAMRDIFAAVRSARSQDYCDLESSVSVLKRKLVADGFVASHAVTTSLFARVLKPGSGPATDALLHDYLKNWKADEERLGVEIDSRVFAYACSGRQAIDNALVHLATAPPTAGRERWRFAALYGLLWPRGSQLLSSWLYAWNPFVKPAPSDRRIALAGLVNPMATVDVQGERWFESLTAALARDGMAGLSAPHNAAPLLKSALLRLMVDPVDVGYLLVYPRSVGIRRTPTGTVALLRVPEATL